MQTRAQQIPREKKAKEAIERAKEMLSRLEADAENCANKIVIANATSKGWLRHEDPQ